MKLKQNLRVCVKGDGEDHKNVLTFLSHNNYERNTIVSDKLATRIIFIYHL